MKLVGNVERKLPCSQFGSKYKSLLDFDIIAILSIVIICTDRRVSYSSLYLLTYISVNSFVVSMIHFLQPPIVVFGLLGVHVGDRSRIL